MAKRTEIARVAKTVNVSEKGTDVRFRKSTIALMSDGDLLEKVTITFRDGETTDYGWNVVGKARGIDANAASSFYAQMATKGYVRA